MPDRILILERDQADPSVWSYGLADAEGRLPDPTHRLRPSPTTGFEPIGDSQTMLWPTVTILVRRAGERDRIVYNLTMRPIETAQSPPSSPESRWERSTAGKSKRPR